jgi:hypothetical protein
MSTSINKNILGFMEKISLFYWNPTAHPSNGNPYHLEPGHLSWGKTWILSRSHPY